MTPCLKNRRLIQVQAAIAWDATLKHRIYSCPNRATHDFVVGAHTLLLKCSHTRKRVPLNVELLITRNPHAPDFLLGIPANIGSRLAGYREAVQHIPGILDIDGDYRFYFLGTEPWPLRMQDLTATASPTEWAAILSIFADPDRFFRWPQIGELVWLGCVQAENDGDHIYPADLLTRLTQMEIRPDTRTNGPAIVSFLVAGGQRPTWGNEGWHIHHIYDGTAGAPHALYDGNLFTHSAGLVAAHPVAHHFAHQSSLLKWLLRREAFLRFGFDPTGDFAAP